MSHIDVEALLRSTVAIVDEIFGDEHPHAAVALENLAATLRRMGRPEEAASVDARALAIRDAIVIRGRRRAGRALPAARPIAPAVLDVAGAAQYLAVSADTVYGLVRSGEIPHARVGKSIRFRAADLDRFVEEKTSRQWLRMDGRGRPRR
jgi:excisionase family DNA binding protein